MECVPNISEGRRPEVVDAVAAAVSGVPGVTLLDRTSDIDHNRSVLTFAGEAAVVATAVDALTGVAIARIDMRRHQGAHPRLGAVDVVPFVPLGETTLDECAALARTVGERLATNFGLPIFLYAAAATRPERRILADIRRPQFEGIGAAMATTAGAPDFGPATPHPSAGATVVGARPFLIAYNIDLGTADVGVAKRIAKLIRERDGGLPRVQALGLLLEDLGRAQVSMNLLDFRVTPLWRVYEEVTRLAAAEGVAVHDSELIGLAPLAAFTDVAERLAVDPTLGTAARITVAAAALRVRGFEPTMALELRLAARAATGS